MTGAAMLPDAPPVSTTARAHVLVVDDDADLLRLLTIRLQAGDYRVSAVGSAEAALAHMAVELPDVLITDVRLPGRDGLALFDEVRGQHAALPVILLTAHGSIPDAVAATARGAFAYLTKPFDGKVLLDKVAQAVRLTSVSDAAHARLTLFNSTSHYSATEHSIPSVPTARLSKWWDEVAK